MSDFDALLERLVSDPGFQSALATDPERALAGYQLEPDERELLSAQIVAGTGGERTVEIRTSKSGLAGMLGPVAAAFGLSGVHESFGAAPAPGHQAFGAPSGHEAFGAGSGHEAFGSAGGGSAAPGTGEAFGSTAASSGTGEAFGAASGGSGQALGVGDQAPEGAFGAARIEASDYHTHVDADGDGHWDTYTAYQRSDGGVDIAVDTDHDGRVDFIGHDYNRDGLIDDADYDTDGDGVMDTRMYDDTGDGWMDRSQRIAGTS